MYIIRVSRKQWLHLTPTSCDNTQATFNWKGVKINSLFNAKLTKLDKADFIERNPFHCRKDYNNTQRKRIQRLCPVWNSGDQTIGRLTDTNHTPVVTLLSKQHWKIPCIHFSDLKKLNERMVSSPKPSKTRYANISPKKWNPTLDQTSPTLML